MVAFVVAFVKARISRKKIGLLVVIIACILFVYRAFWGPPSLYQESNQGPSQTNQINQINQISQGHSAEYLAALPNMAPIGDDQPVSRAMAAKMLVLTVRNTADIYAKDMAHPFVDIDPNNWYAPYVNTAYILGFMRGGGDRFMADLPLTFGQAQTLIQGMDPQNAPTFANFANITDPNLPVSYALWVDLYKQLLEGKSEGRTIYEAFGIIAMDIIILATSANSPLPQGRLISDRGPLNHRGLTLDAYIDRQIRVLVKDREIIAIDALVSDRPILKGAYIVDIGRSEITIFAGGVERIFYLEGSAGNIRSGNIADIKIYSGRVISATPILESVQGTVLRMSEDRLEIKGHGLLPVARDFRVYDISEGPVRWRSRADIIVGTGSARFYIRDGRVKAGVITHEEFPELIRVVIGSSNFDGWLHNSVSVTASGNFWVTAGSSEDARLLELAPGQRFTVSDIENTDLLGHSRLFFHTYPNETLLLMGLGRNWPQGASPRYRGVIEIARELSGYTVINSLCLEEYLYAVVPSEMPSVYGLEASKVQAVTARSFAVHQIMANRFHEWGGNIDDSVISQVYNNIPENEISIEAVEATRGMVLWYGDEIVRANYFSTSSGMTANSGEVWSHGPTFPTYTPSFLQARPQFSTYQAPDSDSDSDLDSSLNPNLNLNNEANASAFFRNQDIDAYDSHSPWFRWSLEMTPAEVSASVNAQAGTHIGTLQNLVVLRRGAGGNIMELHIIGDESDIIIQTEFRIRNILRPARGPEGGRDIALRRHDGSTLLNLSMLPSAFFTFDKIRDHEGTIERIIFHGGGHGHGVGMSQQGVRGMVERGYTFDDILRHFYPDTILGSY